MVTTPPSRRSFLSRLVAAGATGAGLAAGGNARWEFLRMNLGVFPGTEALFESDDELFWRLKPNLRGVEASERLADAEHPFAVSTDARGRRVTAPVEGVARTVLFLGDSCTFGIPVHDDEAFPALVQRELPGTRSLNAGVPGYSAFQGRIVLERMPADERFDAVVITFWLNGRSSWDRLSDAEHAELLAAERAGEFSRHRLTRLWRRASPEPRPRLSEAEFGSELLRLIGLARERGARPIVVVWPAAFQMTEPGEDPRQRLLREIARDAPAPLVDLPRAFRAERDRRLFVDPVHADRRGYQVAARAIAAALERERER